MAGLWTPERTASMQSDRPINFLRFIILALANPIFPTVFRNSLILGRKSSGMATGLDFARIICKESVVNLATFSASSEQRFIRVRPADCIVLLSVTEGRSELGISRLQ
jgi:hypothetical protein